MFRVSFTPPLQRTSRSCSTRQTCDCSGQIEGKWQQVRSVTCCEILFFSYWYRFSFPGVNIVSWRLTLAKLAPLKKYTFRPNKKNDTSTICWPTLFNEVKRHKMSQYLQTAACCSVKSDQCPPHGRRHLATTWQNMRTKEEHFRFQIKCFILGTGVCVIFVFVYLFVCLSIYYIVQ